MWGDISWWLWFVVLWWLALLSIFFVCLLPICVSSLEKCLFKASGHFLKLSCLFFGYWVVCTIYNFWILTSYQTVMSFANIFSHSVGSLFILSMVSFAVQKLLILMCPICLFLLFKYCLRRQLQNIYTYLRFKSKNVLLMFSSRRYRVSGLTFRSLIHF